MNYYFIQILSTSILILFLITACLNKQNELPLIDEEKMRAIIIDMHFAQAASQFRLVSKDSLLQAHKSDYYPQIFEMHKITEAEYEASYSYYLNNPEILLDIYDKVTEELTKMEAQIQQP